MIGIRSRVRHYWTDYGFYPVRVWKLGPVVLWKQRESGRLRSLPEEEALLLAILARVVPVARRLSVIVAVVALAAAAWFFASLAFQALTALLAL